ncbi:MAG TPA: DUF6491 family protein [Rhizomicrobium sp.]
MKKVVFAAIGFALCALPAQADSNCLQVGRIWSWKPLNDRTLIVEDQLYEKFKVGLEGYCPRLPFKLGLQFKSLSGINGLDCLRRGDEVVSQDIGVHYTCPIMSIAPYTPAMEKADKPAGP